jgi:hypothetical protein
MHIKKYKILILIALVALIACKKKAEYKPLMDIKAAKVDKWIRYDDLLSHIDSGNPGNSIQKLKALYPEFSRIYFTQIIKDPGNPDTNWVNIFHSYDTSSVIRALRDTIGHQLGDLSAQESLFSNAFARLQKLLPGHKTPQVYTAITGFMAGAAVISDTSLLLSPEMYLGSGHYYYDPQKWPMYIQRTMNKDNMATNLLKSYIRFNILPQQDPKDLLGYMIREGKEAWLMYQIIPAEMDTLVYDYSKKQLDFCRSDEKEIWAYFIKENLVYETNLRKIGKYVNPSPNVPGMPPDAPGRVAAYTGFKIVQSYLERYPEEDLTKFLQNTNAKGIFMKSKYKP